MAILLLSRAKSRTTLILGLSILVLSVSKVVATLISISITYIDSRLSTYLSISSVSTIVEDI